ncbi:4711_t:CDS:10 [Paraglomus occultum]|uniref:4711_t:CDS:1 n=1 Tax=Paraglomus occultum TaxID=144539 RepID=A0A9N8VTZ3_9GLOM|nr:4711_t:CDS:10 [Paraglomus occultum]
MHEAASPQCVYSIRKFSLDSINKLLQHDNISADYMDVLNLVLQKMQVYSNHLEKTMDEVLCDTSTTTISLTFVPFHMSYLDLLCTCITRTHCVFKQSLDYTELIINSQESSDASIFDYLRNCTIKSARGILMTAKHLLGRTEFIKEDNLSREITNWLRKAHSTLEKYLIFLLEYTLNIGTIKDDRRPSLYHDIANADIAAADFQWYNLLWKYFVKLSVQCDCQYFQEAITLSPVLRSLCRELHKNHGKLLSSLAGVDIANNDIGSNKQLGRQLAIVRFYVAHLLDIAKCYAKFIVKDEERMGELWRCLIYIRSKLPPENYTRFQLSTQAMRILHDRIVPGINNVFLALVNSLKEEHLCIKAICSFINYTITVDESSTAASIGEVEIMYAKIQYLQTILRNFFGYPIQIQTRLVSEPTNSETGTQNCFLLRTFFKLVDDYFLECVTTSGNPKFNDYSELSDSIDENTRPVNDALYVQIVVTITVLGNILSPTLFVVWEIRLLEALLLSRSHLLCGIIFDCWCCVARSLNSTELDNQIQFLIDLLSHLAIHSRPHRRLRRLINRLTYYLSPENQLNIADKYAMKCLSRYCTAIIENDADIDKKKLLSACADAWKFLNRLMDEETSSLYDVLFSIAEVIHLVRHITKNREVESGIKTRLIDLATGTLRKIVGFAVSENIAKISKMNLERLVLSLEASLALLTSLQPLSATDSMHTLDSIARWLSSNSFFAGCVCLMPVCGFIGKCAALELGEDNKMATFNAFAFICNKLLRNSHWVVQHESIAQTVYFVQHTHHPEVIRTIVPQEYQELIMKFTKNMATNYSINNNIKLEASPRIAAFGGNNRRSRTVRLHSISHESMLSLPSQSMMTRSAPSLPTDDLIVSIRKVRQYIQKCNLVESAMEFSSEFMTVLTDLNTELMQFFQKHNHIET